MARKVRLKKPLPEDQYYVDDPEELGRRVAIRPDTLWWLLQERFIELHEFYAARKLQWHYQVIQIQPPRCFLVGPGQKGFGVSRYESRHRVDRQYPDDGQFDALKHLARIRQRMSSENYLFLEALLCVYVAEDTVPNRERRNWLRQNSKRIRLSMLELAWACGFTTENPHDEDRQADRLGCNRKSLQGKPSRFHAGRMRAESYGDVAKVLGDEAYFQPRNRAAV